MSWERIDLNDPELDKPATPPDIGTFLYSTMRHVYSGPPESAKTLIAYNDAILLVRAGKKVCVIDFEMGARPAKQLLRELGATPEDLTLIWFVTPETQPELDLVEIIEWGPTLVIIDAAVGAYQASGLDDNSRKDAEAFARIWINPFWHAGIATLLLDHVTKSAEGRGKFTIGSERKVGQTDVHIGFAIGERNALTRGGSTTVEATVHKDRGAFLPRPTAGFIDITSHAETHHLTVVHRTPEEMPISASGEMRPTIKMEQASKRLEKHPVAITKTALYDEVKGSKPQYERGIEILIREGYVEAQNGPRNSILLASLKPYRIDLDEGSFPVSPELPPSFPGGGSQGVVDSPSPTFPTPLKGGEGDGEAEAPAVMGRNRPASPTSFPPDESGPTNGSSATPTSVDFDDQDRAFLEGLQ